MSVIINLPDMITERSLDEFLLECAKVQGLSDILIQSDDYVFAKIQNVQRKISNRRIDPNEVDLICAFKYGKSAMGVINSGEALDFTCSVQRSVNEIINFRANATRGRVGDYPDGISITLRFITDIPRPLESLGLEQEIIDNLFPQYGLVLVIGTTGSGKSTILSSANRFRLESRQDKPVKIITYEDPIEYTYQALGAGVMPKVFQAEIGPGRHLSSFDKAGPNAMRRGADVIVLGEMRDTASVEEGFALAMTGHCVYATLHVESPAQVIDRVVSFFPYEAQPAAASKLRSVLRLVIAQKQFATKSGVSARIRSWCVFDREVSALLARERHSDWERVIGKICMERKSDFELKAFEFLTRGEIDLEDFCTIASFTLAEGLAYCSERGFDASSMD